MSRIVLEKPLKFISIGIFFIFAFLFFLRPVENGDVWWHLSAGEWILEHKQVPTEDVFASTEERPPWILSQWLGSSIFYSVYNIGGFIGLKIFRVLFFFLVLWVFSKHALRYIPVSLLLIILTIASFAMDTRILLRPLVFNFLFIQYYLFHLYNHADNDSYKKIFLIPALSVVWFNLHIGAFVYGLTLTGTFLLAYCIQLITDAKGGRLIIRKFYHLLIVFFAQLISFLFNPYCIKGALFPIEAILKPNTANQKIFFNIVAEMQAPTYILSLEGIWFYALCACVILSVFRTKKNFLLNILLFIISLAVFIYSNRGLPLFICSSIYIILSVAKHTGLKEQWGTQRLSSVFSGLLSVFLATFLILQSIGLVQTFIYSDNQLKQKMTLQVDPYNPNDAIEFLKENHITGNIFNWEGFGGNILFEAYPELKPFVDGRQLDKRAFIDYLKINHDPKQDWNRIQREYNFQIALLDANFGTLSKTYDFLIKRPDWQLVFLSGSKVIFVKRYFFNLSPKVDHFEQSLRKHPAFLEEAIELLQVKYIMKKPLEYNEHLEEGVALFSGGFYGAGLSRLMEAYRINPSEKTKRLLSLAVKQLSQ